MWLAVVSITFLVISLILGKNRKFDPYSIVIVLFWISWTVSLFMTIPYLYYFNTVLIILSLVLMKSNYSLILMPLVLMRASQILILEGKYVTLLVLSSVFVLIFLIILYKNRKNLNKDFLLFAFGATLIEVVNYFAD